MNFYDSKNKISCIKFKIINSIWLLLLNIIIYSETYLNFGFTILGHAAQKSKLHNLQYDEGGNHMAEKQKQQRSLNKVYWRDGEKGVVTWCKQCSFLVNFRLKYKDINKSCKRQTYTHSMGVLGEKWANFTLKQDEN